MNRTILLADDSVTIQKVIELTFMDDDYRVIAASNGDEALVKLESTRPDIVLADVHMPGANGYVVARRAKERWPGVPVLLLVGTFEPFDEGEALASGADGHMKKPFDSQELQRRVEELIGAAGAAGAPAAPARLDETLPPAPEPFTAFEEEAPRRAGFDFQLESLPVAFPVPEPEQAAATVFAPVVSDFAVAFAIDADEPDEVVPFVAEDAPEIEMLIPESQRAAPAPVPVATEPTVATPATTATVGSILSDDDVERIARRVVELLGDKPVRDVAWEVVPDLAEVVIRERLRELESQIA